MHLSFDGLSESTSGFRKVPEFPGKLELPIENICEWAFSHGIFELWPDGGSKAGLDRWIAVGEALERGWEKGLGGDGKGLSFLYFNNPVGRIHEHSLDKQNMLQNATSQEGGPEAEAGVHLRDDEMGIRRSGCPSG